TTLTRSIWRNCSTNPFAGGSEFGRRRGRAGERGGRRGLRIRPPHSPRVRVAAQSPRRAISSHLRLQSVTHPRFGEQIPWPCGVVFELLAELVHVDPEVVVLIG